MTTFGKLLDLGKVRRKARIKKLEAKGVFHFLRHQFGPDPSADPKSPPAGVLNLTPPEKGEKKSVQDISRQACIGCGLCYAVCKAGAIEMARDEIGFVPRFTAEDCNHCGLCYRVCPGVNVRAYPAPLGEIKKMIIGHAKDPLVRHDASSGGVCRSILKALLDQKIVDKVIITRATDDPFTPETIVTSSIEDLAGNRLNSIYSPASPLAAMKGLDKNLKYAFVGLPCQIAGLAMSPLKKRIHVSIGIFCSHTPSFQFVKQYLCDLAPENEVQSLRYRGAGWPGKSKVYFKDGDICDVRFPAMWHTYNHHKAYQQPRCSMCSYYSAEFADLAIGDPWILAKKDHDGTSLVFIRTERGQEVIDQAADLLTIETVAPEMEAPILEFHINSVAKKKGRGAR